MLLNNQTDIEIIDAKNETTRYPISQLKGVELKMTVKDYRLVYEFKIPIAMKSGYSFAVGANTGNTISVGLETGAMEDNKNKSLIRNPEEDNGESPTGAGITGGTGQGTGGGDDYGGESGGRMRGGDRGRNRGAGFNSSAQAVDFWANVKLSSGSK